MAVETADGGALDARRPLTPPAEFMDIDLHPQSNSLSNGHHLKDSSPNTAPLTGNSTQATSVDEIESTEANGTDAPVVKANELASKLNNHHPAFEEGDTPSRAPQDQSNHRNRTHHLSEEGADKLDDIDSTSPLPQQPTSDLRQQPHPATPEQSSEIKEQKEQEHIARDPELANELLADSPQSTHLPSSAPAPASFASEIKSEFTPTDRDLSHGLAAPESFNATGHVPNHPPVPALEGKLPEEPIDPAPSPTHSMDNIEHESAREQMSLDPETPAGSQPPLKVARPREDDRDEAPAAKRSKVEGGTLPVSDMTPDNDVQAPAQSILESIADAPNTASASTELALPITAPQKKHLIKALQNTKRATDAKPFLVPVDPIALNIPNYPNVVTHPMDLKTMEEKLKSDQYTSVKAFESDFDQIIKNAVAFNGQDHAVTRNAHAMARTFERGMMNLPGPDVQAPTPADKKSRKTSLPLANKAGPPRREPRTSLPAAPGPAPAPTPAASLVATPSATYALTMDGIPLIRRDSTKGDGRPKREIHPPAPRDLPYAASKPRRKKYQAELKFCLHVMTELRKPRYAALAAPFLSPVDPVALNIPDYLQVIKKPMDMGTVKEKLDKGQYENAKEFETDMKLVFKNARTYNPPDHPVHVSARQLDDYFDREMGQKRVWIEANSPVSGPQSAASSDEEDGEDEDEGDGAEEDPDEDQLTKLQRSIALMSEQVKMLQQKKKSPPAANKKAGKGAKADKKGIKKGASAQPVKQEKKAPTKHSKKEQYVTYEQKQDISNRINSLSEPKMAKALKIIRDNMPGLKVTHQLPFDSRTSVDTGLTGDAQGVQDDELELDIDELSDDVLRKLHDFVRRNSKGGEEVPRPPPVAAAAPAPARKKNKPMSKQEQERQIQDLKNITSQFTNPTPSIENAPDACKSSAYGLGTPPNSDGSSDAVHHDTSGDEDDSEESEEE
ncbi:MAG: hypothetical protein LQ344_002358 [Seirophora lacunosa]|nr:MAG: hypothetical protein LQ344_002358 [Seirophora lacunosa]